MSNSDRARTRDIRLRMAATGQSYSSARRATDRELRAKAPPVRIGDSPAAACATQIGVIADGGEPVFWAPAPGAQMLTGTLPRQVDAVREGLHKGWASRGAAVEYVNAADAHHALCTLDAGGEGRADAMAQARVVMADRTIEAVHGAEPRADSMRQDAALASRNRVALLSVTDERFLTLDSEPRRSWWTPAMTYSSGLVLPQEGREAARIACGALEVDLPDAQLDLLTLEGRGQVPGGSGDEVFALMRDRDYRVAFVQLSYATWSLA